MLNILFRTYEGEYDYFSQIAQDSVQQRFPNLQLTSLLRNLKQPLQTLRQAYQTDNVTVDYNDPVIALAYQLAYTPFHIRQTLETLRKMTHILLPKLHGKREIELACLCGGPGAEVVAFQLWLQEVGLSPRELKVRVYDLNADTWDWCANYQNAQILADTRVEWQYKSVDFEQVNVVVGLRNADVVMAQNCLNEINLANPVIQRMFRTMKEGSVFVFSDLSSYRSNLAKLHDLRRELSTTHVVPNQVGYVNMYGFEYTSAMETHFFTSGTICKGRRTLRTAYMYAVKR